MEALKSDFVGGIVCFCTDESTSLQLGRGVKACKVAAIRSSSTLGEDAVRISSKEASEEQNAVINILRGGLGRSKSSWWTPLFNLPSEASSLSSSQSDKHTPHSSAVASLLSKQPNLRRTNNGRNTSNKEENQLTTLRNKSELPQLEVLSNQGSPSGDGGKKGELKQLRSVKFTAEKARMLRQELRSSETWHDFMYHSAIASRLATSDNFR